MVTTKASDKPASTPRSKVDWEAVERDYRATQMTLRELAAKHGCSHVRIQAKAKQHSWTRDLGPAVRRATKNALVDAAVNAAVTSAVNTAEQAVPETIQAMAELNKQVILGHRTEITNLRALAAGLLSELSASALTPAEQQELAALLVARPDGEKPTAAQLQRTQALVRKSTDLAGRITSVRSLTETFTRLQLMERTAFGLDEKDPPQPPSDLQGVALSELKRMREQLSHE